MLRRLTCLSAFALVCAVQSHAPAAAAERIFDVTAYGAVGDGRADDTPAIQRAVNAAASADGGGTVYFPARTYLLDSYSPSGHPWMFRNLLIGSNVTLAGQRGAKLLQGPGGRHALIPGATEVRNTVLASAWITRRTGSRLPLAMAVFMRSVQLRPAPRR